MMLAVCTGKAFEGTSRDRSEGLGSGGVQQPGFSQTHRTKFNLELHLRGDLEFSSSMAKAQLGNKSSSMHKTRGLVPHWLQTRCTSPCCRLHFSGREIYTRKVRQKSSTCKVNLEVQPCIRLDMQNSLDFARPGVPILLDGKERSVDK